MNVNFELNLVKGADDFTVLFNGKSWAEICAMGQHVQRVMGVDLDAAIPFLAADVDLADAAEKVASSTELSDEEKTMAFIFGIRGLKDGRFDAEHGDKSKDNKDEE